MESNKPREVTIRRSQLAQQPEAAHDGAAAGAENPPDSPSTPGEDPNDDLPVSSDQPEADSPWIAAPSYGEMGHLFAQDAFDPELPPPIGRDDQPAAPLLEAWHAAYGHPAQTELLRRPAVAEALAAAASGAGDRAQVDATDTYPWRCVCALIITAADGTRWLGTGWLAGARTIVTAGHCVYLHRHGGWARQVEIIPGLNAGQRPYGFAVAASFRSVKGWVDKRLTTHNYGAVILPPDRAFGNLLGHFGYANLADLDLQGARASLAGYWGDQPRGAQWHQAQPLAHLASRTLDLSAGAAGALSGAPVWVVRNTQRYVMGIHVGGQIGGAAVRIAAPVFGNLDAWKREGA